MARRTTTAGLRAGGAMSSAGRQLVGPVTKTRWASMSSTLAFRLVRSVA